SAYWTQIRYREATLSDQMQQQLIDHSTRLFERLGCRDYARFDFRTDAKGEIKLLEVNPNAGWCWDGKMNIMAGFAGIRYLGMLSPILQAALERPGVVGKPAPQQAAIAVPHNRPAPAPEKLPPPPPPCRARGLRAIPLSGSSVRRSLERRFGAVLARRLRPLLRLGGNEQRDRKIRTIAAPLWARVKLGPRARVGFDELAIEMPGGMTEHRHHQGKARQ